MGLSLLTYRTVGNMHWDVTHLKSLQSLKHSVIVVVCGCNLYRNESIVTRRAKKHSDNNSADKDVELLELSYTASIITLEKT